ncbi:MAG: hypothetical protein V1837_06705 [Candidatus Woesearchaeota archaeon]
MNEKVVIMWGDNSDTAEYLGADGTAMRITNKGNILERKMKEAGITEQEMLMLLEQIKQKRLEHKR